MITTETYRLANGVEIPKLGLGTWLMDDEQTAKAVEDAIRIGYRHVDTAQAYGNEAGLARGIRNSGVKREEIFVTSKIAAEEKSYERAAASIDESLERMGFAYIDLMIIHSPQPWADVNQSENRYLEENVEVWRALEDAYKAGKVRAIGLSNFLQQDVENILAHCTVKPMVNQILAHITNTPFELINFCQANDILVEAYSPIAHGAVLHNPEVKAIADRYQVSVAQLCLAYDLQLNLVVIPKTANPAHMKNNTEVEFTISAEDMATLKNLDRMDDYGEHGYFPVFGGKI